VLLGGVLTDVLSWEWVLLVNVPIATGAAAVAPFVLSESRDGGGARGFDVQGAILVAAGLIAVVLAIVGIDKEGLLSARTLGVCLLGILLLGAFALHERRTSAPLVPFASFASRNLTASNLVAIAYSVGPFSFFLLGALYLQGVLGYSPLQTGVGMLPFTLVAALMSITVVRRLVGRVGLKPMAVGGMLTMAVALVLLSFVSEDGSYVTDVLPAAIVLGLGIQFAFVAVNIAALKEVDKRLFGLASGLLNTSLQIGAALGLAVVATLATSQADPVAGLRLGALAGAAILTAGAGAAFLLPRGSGAPAIVVAETGAGPLASSLSSRK
jgi:Na+/melibiose symporter-like transporter